MWKVVRSSIVPTESAVALAERLEQRRERHPEIAQVRGLGSMVAIELRDPEMGAPDPAALQRVHKRALDRGLLLLSCGMHGNAIRFLYPLTIENPTFTRALAILDQSLPSH